MSLFDDYDPEKPYELPMNRMYAAETGPFPGRVVVFAGITSGKTKEGKTEDVFNLWLSDLVTGELDCHQTSREGLREFRHVPAAELSGPEKDALETRAKLYAHMCVAFSELVKDPNAGKGPEHFC